MDEPVRFGRDFFVRGESAEVLNQPAFGAFPVVGNEVHLHVRFGKDRGPDVPAVYNDIPFGRDFPDPIIDPGPDRLHPSDARHGSVDCRIPDLSVGGLASQHRDHRGTRELH
jgi:hypothetical protein